MTQPLNPTLQESQSILCLLAIPDRRGVYHFPQVGAFEFGIHCQVSAHQESIDSAQSHTAAFLDDIKHHSALTFYPDYSDSIEISTEQSVPLYLAKCELAFGEAAQRWPTLPQILRASTSTQNRRTLMKAMQVFAGGLEESSYAVEAEQVMEWLKEPRN